MWSGQFLAGPWSDQHSTGYAIRYWGAEQWRMTGHPPLWNPEMMGGVPVFAGFGDLFYPTAWLRLVLPTVTAMNLAFVVHYLLAGEEARRGRELLVQRQGSSRRGQLIPGAT